MGFTETRLEIGVKRASGGPSFRTTIIQAGSGYEQRNATRTQYLYSGDIGNLILTEQEVNYVLAFFAARKGRGIGFRWKYWGDFFATAKATQVDPYTVTQGVTFPAIGDGSNQFFQLQKKYTSFQEDSYKFISKPVQNAVIMYIDGVVTTDLAIDYTRGYVVFNSPPASDSIITWEGEFDLSVRFDTDAISGVTESIDPVTGKLCFRFDSLAIVETIEPSTLISLYSIPSTQSSTSSSSSSSNTTSPTSPTSPGSSVNYSCFNGYCFPDPNGSYSTLAACQAALIHNSFTGGQCDIIYGVNCQGYNNGVAQGGGFVGFFFGPIQGCRVNQNSDGWRLQILCNGRRINPATNTITGPQGIGWYNADVGGDPYIGPLPFPYSFSIDNVTPDGGSDNCGNPPSIVCST